MIHVVVYRLVGMAAGLDENSSVLLFVAIMIISWALIVALSYPLTKLLDEATRLCMRPAEKAMQAASKFFE